MGRLYDRCKRYRESIGAPWFTEPWDLNLLVARSGTVGEWDDRVIICCRDDADRPIVQVVRATGDAWEGEWLEPTHPDGCLYVLDQHVPGGLQLGEHRGRPALRQIKPFRCVRWAPDGTVPTVDQLEARAAAGHDFYGVQGTHLHNNWDGTAPPRPRRNESEGCTVSLWWHQHAAMIELVKLQRRHRGTDIVSPTYLSRQALRAA